MPNDIRSYFKPLGVKKDEATQQSTTKKTHINPHSSDEDFISGTPHKSPERVKQKKRKAKILEDSDSDIETKTQSKKPKSTKEESTLKKVNALDVFGNEPVKQSEVKKTEKTEQNRNFEKPAKKSVKTEVGIHDDNNFEKSLLELDEDVLLNNIDILDETVQDAQNASCSKESHDEDSCEDTSVNKKTKKKQEKANKNKVTPKRRRSSTEHYEGDPDQERYEKRVQSAILYQKYLHRGGPAHHGSKEWPKGKPDCLKNLCFLRTGVLDSLEGEEFEQLVKDHGGRTVHAVSKKVNYLVVGEEPGPAKLEKARNYGIPTISEDQFLDLIRIKSGMKPIYSKNADEIDFIQGEASSESFKESKELPGKESKTSKQRAKSSERKSKTPERKVKSPSRKPKTPERRNKSPEKKNLTPEGKIKTTLKPNLKKLEENSQNKLNLKIQSSSTREQFNKCEKELDNNLDQSTDKNEYKPSQVTDVNNNLSLTEKYKPQNTKAIIGQQGEKSNMKKLMFWLENWHKNHSGKNKPKLLRPSPWSKDDKGAFFKAALLSGPPGVGKTTTATLVSRELGFDIVEFNASDTRNKKLLHEEISQLLSTKSLAGYIKDGSEPTVKHVLLMDEVDGMSGNEDRGGMQELISLIKNTHIPIICMCNDRNNPKVRSLANYCFDLRFQRPRLEQIRGFLMTVCCREHLNVPPNALSEIITGTGMDIRQALNHLSMWATGNKGLSVEMAKKEAAAAQKNVVLGPWEVCRKVFSRKEHENMSIPDRARLFFYDYSIAPLFIQENYLQVVPHAPKEQILVRVARTADAISFGDIIDSKIRTTNNWSLLDVEAMYFSVLPGTYMGGHVGGQINFPNWLGKNSKRGRFQRMVTDIQAHMRTSTSASRMSVNLDYISHLRNRILMPLIKHGVDGINEALEIIHSYNLSRDDYEAILEIAQWSRKKDPSTMLDAKVKTAFTRAYNKDTILPYALSSAPVEKRAAVIQEDIYEDETLLEDDEDEDDVTKDSMIRLKKAGSKKDKTIDEPTTSEKKTKKGKKKDIQDSIKETKGRKKAGK